MARRFGISVLLAVLVVLAGCSQLASAPSETPTPTEANANTTTETATPSPTETIQGGSTTVGTTTSAATPTTTATPTATPSPTPSPTPTPTPTATPTSSPTATPTPTPTPTPEPKFVVIVGGEPDDKVNYRLSVTGTIERRGKSYGAPIADRHVTKDSDIDIISGSRVAGRLGGGGDAYRITGEITAFEAEGDVTVYIDGEETDLE